MDDGDTSTIGLGSAIAILGIITVVLRFHTRYKKRASLKWDDWLILASLLLALATDILVVYSSSIDPGDDEGDSTSVDGGGSHRMENDALITAVNLFSFIATVLYFSITSTTKLSILFLYNRLFSVSHTFRRQIVILSILVIGYWFGSTIANLLNCIPLQYYWIYGDSDPRFCFDYNIFWFATGISEAFIDLLILLLPIGVVAKLHLSTKKKIATGSVFVVGIFVIASGLLKAVYGLNLDGTRLPSWKQTRLWSTIHTGTGIICACLPVCWPVFASLGRLKEWTWARGMNIKTSHSWRGWSRLRAGSVQKEGVEIHETRLDTGGKVRILSLDREAMVPFDVEFEIERPVEI
ncbi:hypothetical protein GGR58DRAFT_462723 [Xylaria digitata]|nr:hypothetical protein GGR58DRAFT_462723 [Xylaria digitata]